MEQSERPKGAGAFEFEQLLDKDTEPLPDQFQNPSGVGRGECDTESGGDADAACDLESTAEVSDLVLEETKPGVGIEGFEGEEDGGS